MKSTVEIDPKDFVRAIVEQVKKDPRMTNIPLKEEQCSIEASEDDRTYIPVEHLRLCIHF